LSDGTDKTFTAGGDSLPSQTGNNGKYLQTDGSAASWQAVASATQAVYNYTDNFVINDALNGSTVTTYGAIKNISGTFSGDFSPKFHLGIMNEVGSAILGGTATVDGDYTVRTFTTSGTLRLVSNITADILVIGGGGGGAGDRGGGGGAGGYRYLTSATIASGTHTVTVGSGGDGDTIGNGGECGDDSVFLTTTATGGGGGAAGTDTGKNGGSGGGGGTNTSKAGGAGNSPPTIPAQGYNGGSGLDAVSPGAGGGGGAGGAGANGTNAQGGNGGIGVANSITGTELQYAGGGGGAAYSGAGGSGTYGGGAGSASGAGSNGTDGTGGGGGGGTDSNIGGNGGKGIVIIRYLTSSLPSESSSITLVPKTGQQLPFTISAENNLRSDAKGDYIDIFLSNTWISRSVVGTWVDEL
jgi:hypothetical protein